MEVNKSKLLKVFNTHFFEFIDDIIRILPENVDIKSSRILFELTKKANPTLFQADTNIRVKKSLRDKKLNEESSD